MSKTSLQTLRAVSCCGTAQAHSSAKRTSSSRWTPWTVCLPESGSGRHTALVLHRSSGENGDRGRRVGGRSGSVFDCSEENLTIDNDGPLQTLNVLLFKHCVPFCFCCRIKYMYSLKEKTKKHLSSTFYFTTST